MTAPVRLEPLTTILHLDYNAGEDSTVELEVTDNDEQPVPISAAVATVGQRGGSPLHEWSVDEGNLAIADQASQPGRLWLRASREETARWSREWGDARWQLDVIDLFGRSKRACSGQVRVWAGRRFGEERPCP